jgi:hypothetical protein
MSKLYMSVPLASIFYRMVRHFDLIRAANAREIELLAMIRDALLPKLLSSELRCSDCEKTIGDSI